MTASADARAVLIAGHGRSGTNWLLQLLDFSTATWCRNEPDELGGTAFDALPSAWRPITGDAADETLFGRAWPAALAQARTTIGDRDRAPAVRKAHLAGGMQHALLHALARPRLRAALGRLVPAWRAAQWPVPGLSAERAARALLVLKCNQVPAWAAHWLHCEREARVLHIVRHPGGFLRSWRNRYVSGRDAERVLARNRVRLRAVAERDPRLREALAQAGGIDALDLEDSELWFWRHAVETIETAGAGHPGYHRVLFESLAACPQARAREIYEWLGLDWTPEVASAVAARSAGALHIAGRWADELDAPQRRRIERVLRGSRMEQWWATRPEPEQR